MDRLPPEIVDVIIRDHLPAPEDHCALAAPQQNPNKTRAVNRFFRARSAPKQDCPCRREIFHYLRIPVRCSVHTDAAFIQALRVMDESTAGALRELRRHQSPVYGPPPYTAYIHVLKGDMRVLGGARWHRHLALPGDVVITGSCCGGAGIAIQLRSSSISTANNQEP